MSRKKIESKTIIGKRIRDIRCKKGVTQIELAEKSGVGLSRIKLYESGDAVPHTDALVSIASALNYPPFDLCNDSECDNVINKLFDEATKTNTVEALDPSVVDLLAFFAEFKSPNVADFINALHKYNGREIVRVMSQIQNMMERIENTKKQDGDIQPYLPDDATSVRIATTEWFEYYGSLLGDEIARGIKAWATDKLSLSNDDGKK